MNQRRRAREASIIETLKNKIHYFGDQSNLHGVGRIFSLNYIPFLKRLFWLLVVLACCVGAGKILLASLEVYSENAVSYSVETNYLHWDTPFPALTICELLDAERVKAYLVKNKYPTSLTPFYKDVSYWNAKYCKTCTKCEPNKTCLEDIEGAVREYRLKCPELLTECWYDEKPFPCCERFHPIESEYGTCFVFNSRLVGNKSSLVTVSRRTGLPALVFSATKAIAIRIHSPDDIVSVAMENLLGKNSLLPLITDFDATLKAEQTISDSFLISMDSELRGCLFRNERPKTAYLWPYDSYSYSACLLYCRTLAQADACNCTHHFMPKLADYPVCDIPGLACLYQLRDSLVNVPCECPMACEEILYKVVHIFYKRHTGNLTEELVERGTRGRFRLIQLPVYRERRHAIKDTLSFVVDLGGVGGVFFGASLLSVIEIVYLFFVRRGP